MKMAWFGLLLVGVVIAGQQVNPPTQHETYRSPDASKYPVVTYRVEPAYTPEARAKGIEGTVLLRLEVTERGIPENVTVERKLDPGLDANAVEALKKWRFIPARKEGQPIRTAARVEMNFRLGPDRK